MVERPVYKTEKYESPAKLPGVVSQPPSGNGAAPATVPSQHQASPLIHSITETRPHGETETIVKAANSLYRVLAEKIAYHEGEAKKLRQVFQGFAAAGSQAPPDVATSVIADDMTFLRNIANFLEKDVAIGPTGTSR